MLDYLIVPIFSDNEILQIPMFEITIWPTANITAVYFVFVVISLPI